MSAHSEEGEGHGEEGEKKKKRAQIEKRRRRKDRNAGFVLIRPALILIQLFQCHGRSLAERERS